jgi:hypothetical protein
MEDQLISKSCGEERVRAELRRIHEEIRGTEKPTRRRGKRIKRSSAG